MSSPTQTNFRPDIEGLRAIAVLSVITFHAWPDMLAGGFIGVDIFFVLSGFLISRNILKDLGQGNFSITTFYEHRIRRLFPALFFVLIVCSILAYQLFAPAPLVRFGQSLAATALFSSNIYFGTHTGYFDESAQLQPLLHTWSLSVEEQFYVLFPIFLAFLWKKKRSALPASLISLAVLSLAFSVWAAHFHSSAGFFLPLSRGYEFLLGTAIVFAKPERISARTTDALSVVGLCLVAGSIALITEQMPFPSALAFLPGLGVALLILTGSTRSTAISRLLGMQPLRYVGKISYSLYLWHWPILAFSKHYFLTDSLSEIQTRFAVALVFLISAASYQYIEKPFRYGSFGKTALFSSGVGLITVTCAWSASLVMASGFPYRFSPTSLQLFSYEGDFNKRRNQCHGSNHQHIAYDKNCIYGNASDPPTLAVWGDSHGAELSLALGEHMSHRAQSVLQITYSSCPPALNYTPKDRPDCRTHNEEALLGLKSDPRIRTVVLVAYYRKYLDDQWPTMTAGLEQTVRELRQAGKAVILVNPIPTFSYNVPDALGLRASRNDGVPNVQMPLNAYLRENALPLASLKMIANATGARQVRPEDILCTGGSCFATVGGMPAYFDNNHLSLQGARALTVAFD
ncbi:acyltransferase family protein [Cupriavidus sp. 30B13]|uniref:acyltransferase family protein n=1 Tax=Cupriavidus sp. 30B13 TaxID=3384241 RepID=UPI003B920436